MSKTYINGKEFIPKQNLKEVEEELAISERDKRLDKVADNVAKKDKEIKGLETYKDKVELLRILRSEYKKIRLEGRENLELKSVVLRIDRELKEIEKSMGSFYTPKGNYGKSKIK